MIGLKRQTVIQSFQLKAFIEAFTVQEIFGRGLVDPTLGLWSIKKRGLGRFKAAFPTYCIYSKLLYNRTLHYSRMTSLCYWKKNMKLIYFSLIVTPFFKKKWKRITSSCSRNHRPIAARCFNVIMFFSSNISYYFLAKKKLKRTPIRHKLQSLTQP